MLSKLHYKHRQIIDTQQLNSAVCPGYHGIWMLLKCLKGYIRTQVSCVRKTKGDKIRMHSYCCFIGAGWCGISEELQSLCILLVFISDSGLMVIHILFRDILRDGGSCWRRITHAVLTNINVTLCLCSYRSDRGVLPQVVPCLFFSSCSQKYSLPPSVL